MTSEEIEEPAAQLCNDACAEFFEVLDRSLMPREVKLRAMVLAVAVLARAVHDLRADLERLS